MPTFYSYKHFHFKLMGGNALKFSSQGLDQGGQSNRCGGKAPAKTHGMGGGGILELSGRPQFLVSEESRPRVAILCSGNMAATPWGRKGGGGTATLAAFPEGS